MQTGDPVTRFQEIIANVENMIEGEQKVSDSQFRVSQDQCDTDIAAFKIDDNLLVRRLVDIQTSLDSFGPQLAQKEDTFAQKSTFRDVLTTQLTELERQRHAELSEYQLRQKYDRTIINNLENTILPPTSSKRSNASSRRAVPASSK